MVAMVAVAKGMVANRKNQWGGESCPLCYFSFTANWLPSSESSFD
jgi:hypothetical protein